MKFIMIEISEGGADDWAVDYDDACNYLAKIEEWEAAHQEFATRNWLPGRWMTYPCGWIFCVEDDA